MPCIKCSTEFNLINWKQKCNECEGNHCSKCLKRVDGNLFCDTCSILNLRPPNKEQLMSLKVKDIKIYLTRNHVSFDGLVEKQELVDLFFKNGVSKGYKKNGRKFPKTFTGSVPNLASAQACFNNLRSNAEAAINNQARNIGSFVQARTSNAQPGPSTNNSPYQTQVPMTSNVTENGATNSYNSSNVQESTLSTNPTNQSSVRKKKISDFKSIDDLNTLSPKELKELLALNRVDFKGCVEKAELIEKANILWIDAHITNKEEDKNEGGIDNCCKICMDAPLDCVLLECGHIATCINCGKQLNECPICRQYVIRVVRTFKA